ncbi:HAD superfamily hydrolase (TIGR01549 family) [Haloferula luteola]|uniref:HAD superfamily hydrolase (TIGR01549 family) n=1 Tax=Haloferula luteola TaxID=595692 RepID=A0A840UXY2_9BACT|nr:HAD family phosphatase [Haloferula luteola]MBB5350642.1 HAD superfamily hydrolase (TIGR01549 family) [Haloferula luteola]
MASVGSIEWELDGIEGIVFDCDGTLVNSMPAHFAAWCEALAFYGAANVFQEDVFYAMGGRPTKDIVVQLNGDYGLKLNPEAVAMKKREAFLARLPQVDEIVEVVEFARRCRGRIPMAIATGGTRLVIEKTLQALELSDLFDEVVTADDVAVGKPAPDVFLKAAELLGVDPTKCLAVEDAPAGIMAAQQAGMKVQAIPAPLDFSLS